MSCHDNARMRVRTRHDIVYTMTCSNMLNSSGWSMLPPQAPAVVEQHTAALARTLEAAGVGVAVGEAALYLGRSVFRVQKSC